MLCRYNIFAMDATNTNITMAEGFRFVPFPYEGEIPGELHEGDVCSVRALEEQELHKDIPLFIRGHLIQNEYKFSQFFKNQSFSPGGGALGRERRTLYVTGPPGCGKTAFVTLLSHRYAAGKFPVVNNRPKRVLMILFRENSVNEMFIIEGAKTLRLAKPVLHKAHIVEHIRKMLDDETLQPFDLCVLDGVRQSIDVCTQLIQTINYYARRTVGKLYKVIYTTSLQFKFNLGEVPVGTRRLHEEINFDSFNQQDYQEAIQNKEFLERLLTSNPDIMYEILYMKNNGIPNPEFEFQEKDRPSISSDRFVASDDNLTAAQEYFNHNYYYAGGSARFMFEQTTAIIKAMLDTLFNKLTKDDWDAFTTSQLKSTATTSVNTLMQQFNGMTSAVSRYVLFAAYDKVDEALVNAVEAAADQSGNPALKGWAFELRQIQEIKNVLKNNSVDNCKIRRLQSVEGLCFEPVKNGEAWFDGTALIIKDPRMDLKSGIVIWCMKWNQGCFDVAFFKGSTLVTIQFTVGTTHSLKANFIKTLKDAIVAKSGLEVEELIHVGVVGGGEDTVTHFNFDAAEGTGHHSRNMNVDFTIKTYKSSKLVPKEGGHETENFHGTSYLDAINVYTKKRDRTD